MAELRVENLEKVYKGTVETVAVRDFNLRAKEGEIITLAGPSGSGKTTILLCIAGILEPTFGKIIYDNTVINNLSEDELALYRRDKVGVVFQSFNLIDYFTVYENIAFPLWLAKRPAKYIRSRVNTLLDELDIARYARTYPRFLSGGEQQRVAIAVALANDPPIILADEPTGNLDRSTADLVIDLLFREALDHHKLLLLATHDEHIIHSSPTVINLSKWVLDPPS